jgi:mannose-6-phosphate isomerase-like protein (cupin superfamily)
MNHVESEGAMVKVIKLKDKFDRFTDLWSPKIVSRLDGYDVKIVKVKGELVRHDHKDEDELFFVLKGRFRSRARRRDGQHWAGRNGGCAARRLPQAFGQKGNVAHGL